MQSKVKIIRTDDGYMVELPNGDYLCDEHGDNLWDTYDAAWDVVATNYADVNSHIEGADKLDKYPTYHDLLDAVIAQIKVDIAKEDETAIVELLARLPRKVLLSYLPEEETNAH